MSNLSIIEHPDFGQIRTELVKNEPTFCAADVCKALGYKNPSNVIARLCRPKGVSKRYTLTDGGQQELNFIDEGNLYRLILKSNLPAAQKFEDWVCDEVLPAIRRSGSYAATYHANGISHQVSSNRQLAIDFQNLAFRELLKVESRVTRTRIAGLIDFYTSQIR